MSQIGSKCPKHGTELPAMTQEVLTENGEIEMTISDEIFREQQLICQKLSNARNKTLLESDLKIALGYK